MANTYDPEVWSRVGTRDTNVPWYADSLGSKLGDAARELLETYSKIPPEEVESHVYKIRDEGWAVWPYPCIGQFRFLDLAISLSPHYPAILQRLKTGNENFLDLGCCFGHELRKLAADGAPSEHLYGSDLRPEFVDLGYKLFLDKDRLKSRFLTADVFDAGSALGSLDGNVDIIYAGSFLHLFGYAEQVQVCKRIVKLLRDKKGSILVGRQMGNVNAGEHTHRTADGRSRWRHNEESFAKMWEEVGDSTGTKWRVEVQASADTMFNGEPSGGWRDGTTRRLTFAVVRE